MKTDLSDVEFATMVRALERHIDHGKKFDRDSLKPAHWARFVRPAKKRGKKAMRK